MDIRQIHYFIEVVKHGSFSKAAEHLYISQPTISNVIKDLEEELDVKLLIRTTRKLELTDTGRLLFQYGQEISQSLQHFNQELDDIKNNKRGSIRIGIFPMLGMQFLTKTIAEFHQQYPEIIIQFLEDGANHLKKALIDGDLDLAVMDFPIDEASFDFFPFLKGDLRVIVHQDHPLANKELVKWSELVHEQLIILREGFNVHNMIIEEYKRMGFKPNIICETSQWNFMLEMVSINHGITILPLSDYHEFENLKVLPLMDPQVEWQLAIAWRKNSYISHATRTWVDFMKSKLNE